MNQETSPLLSFPRPLAYIIADYCDLGDEGDAAVFASLPGSRERWLKSMQFTEEKCHRAYWHCRQTTIVAGGERMLHSIDDQPCMALTQYKPFDEIKNPFEGHKLNGHPDYDEVSGEDPMRFAVWARFSTVHRNEDFAWFLNTEGNDVSYIRYWVAMGWSRKPSKGHSEKSVFVSNSGFAQDHTYWSMPARFPRLKLIPLAEWPRRDIEKLVPRAILKSHRLEGPAALCDCRNEKEREKQPLEGIKFDPYLGLFPKKRWYIRDFPLKSEEHKTVVKWVANEHLNDEEHAAMVYLLLQGLPLDSKGKMRIGPNTRRYPG